MFYIIYLYFMYYIIYLNILNANKIWQQSNGCFVEISRIISKDHVMKQI